MNSMNMNNMNNSNILYIYLNTLGSPAFVFYVSRYGFKNTLLLLKYGVFFNIRKGNQNYVCGGLKAYFFNKYRLFFLIQEKDSVFAPTSGLNFFCLKPFVIC